MLRMGTISFTIRRLCLCRLHLFDVSARGSKNGKGRLLSLGVVCRVVSYLWVLFVGSSLISGCCL